MAPGCPVGGGAAGLGDTERPVSKRVSGIPNGPGVWIGVEEGIVGSEETAAWLA